MSRLPPGSALPLLQPLRYLKDPYALFRACQAKYGDPFTARTSARMVVTGDPAGVRTIFEADQEDFTIHLPRIQKVILGEHSMTNTTGQAHKRERKVIGPPFQGRAMRACGRMIQDMALQAVDRWAPGQRLVMRDEAMTIALDIILRAIFGVVDAGRMALFRRKVRDFVDTLGDPAFLTMALFRLDWMRLGPVGRFYRAKEALDALIFELIAERRADRAHRTDILGHLIDATYDDGSTLTDVALRDNLVTNLIAGHETSAVTMTWAMYWLARMPEVRARLLDELDAAGEHAEPDALASLPYLDAVIKETLRLWPVVPDVPRILAKPMELKGYTLPPGTYLVACTALVHSREDLYPEPETFSPQRFLERKFSPYEYFPFGGGDRKCSGSHFAVYESKIVLATLLQRGRFRLADPAPPRVKRIGFLMAPEGGVPMLYEGPRSTGQD